MSTRVKEDKNRMIRLKNRVNEDKVEVKRLRTKVQEDKGNDNKRGQE